MAVVKILGVYRPEISEEAYQQQMESLGDEASTKEHFDGLVLVEATAREVDGDLPLEKLGQQPLERPDPSYFLCAYDEALLSADGEALVQRNMGCVHGTGELRFAFYLHYFDAARAVQFEGVDLETPKMEAAPERLMQLVPYNACD